MEIRAVVYDPPRADFPFLAVLFTPDGGITSVAFGTASEAERHLEKAAQKIGATIQHFR